MATTDSIDTAASRDTAAMDRAARRLQAWAGPRPEAALLARYAALAVRVDAPLLRRLRLQLLPRAEPGIEADVWFAGLHESLGRSGFVFDARVQQLLRAQLAAPVPAGARSPLEQAWQITAGLHADWPAALRTEEALTYHALRDDPDAAAQVDALLAPALKAMASGGETRALEVARWAQRAVPRLPDAARRHPAALALWLASLLRLGQPASQLPDTGAAGLPAALRWLLPPAQLATRQRLALLPFDDGLRLQPLDDAAAPAASEITLPRTGPLLLALRVEDADGTSLLQRTLALDANVADINLPLPAAWRALDLASLTGARWRLQRQLGHAGNDEAPLPWQQMRVQVLNAARPSEPSAAVGMGVFVSPTEVVTVRDVLAPGLLQAHQAGDLKAALQSVLLQAWSTDSRPQRLQARLTALDPRSSLVLLTLEQPFVGAVVASRNTAEQAVNSSSWAWTVPGLHGDHSPWIGQLYQGDPQPEPPHGQPAPHSTEQHLGLLMPQTLQSLSGIAGAPVFVDRTLIGIAHLAIAASAEGIKSKLWALPASAIDRFLHWTRKSEADWPLLLLHHAVGDRDSQGTELDRHALRRIEHAARWAKIRLVQDTSRPMSSDPGADSGGSFTPDLAAAVRLVTPTTREQDTAGARMQLLALAARCWLQPYFGVLHLGFQRLDDKDRLPPPLAGVPLQDLMRTEPVQLARQLLDLVDPPGRNQPHESMTQSPQLLQARLTTLARPFQPSAEALQQVLEAAANFDMDTVVELVERSWTRSSRLDAGPLVDVLAQLALPIHRQHLWALHARPRGALSLNTMSVQLARLLIARANADSAPPYCVVVRDQTWEGLRSVDRIEAQVMDALATGLACSTDEARQLLQRLGLMPWVLVATRPLPDHHTMQALKERLPPARFLFLVGPQPEPAETQADNAARSIAMPPLHAGADMHWLSGYKRLMEWAKPRKRATRTNRPTRSGAKPLKK